MKELYQCNVNDLVRFRLTSAGRELLRRRGIPWKVAKDHTITTELWDVMAVLGSTMYVGAPNSIVRNTLTFVEG